MFVPYVPISLMQDPMVGYERITLLFIFAQCVRNGSLDVFFVQNTKKNFKG